MGKPDAWEQTFFEMVEGASMDNLIGSTNMAHYFQINAYVRAASAYLARRTDNMNVKQKREFLHEENDYRQFNFQVIYCHLRLLSSSGNF